jgi:hypothetical protein
MVVRLVCVAALVASGFAPAPLALAAAPAPVAAAQCPEMASLHPATLPASAWAKVDFPSDQEQALRAKAHLEGPAKPPSLRVFRIDPQDNHRVSVLAERTGGGWTLSTVDEKDGKVSSRRDHLRADRATNLDRILADKCFYGEPNEFSSETAEAKCLGAMDLYIEAVVGERRRTAIQHCSPEGLTGQVAEILWNQADVE